MWNFCRRAAPSQPRQGLPRTKPGLRAACFLTREERAGQMANALCQNQPHPSPKPCHPSRDPPLQVMGAIGGMGLALFNPPTQTLPSPPDPKSHTASVPASAPAAPAANPAHTASLLALPASPPPPRPAAWPHSGTPGFCPARARPAAAAAPARAMARRIQERCRRPTGARR